MIKYILFIILYYLSASVNAQNLNTIQLKPIGSLIQLSIVPIGTTLELSFDDLKSTKDYQYKIEQKTYDWKPSNLSSNQYIDGFDQDDIVTITNSFNTLQNYTHHSVQIPNSNTKITKTGNYEISILDEDENILFTKRFVLYKNKTTVGVSVTPTRVALAKNQEQNVKVIVNHKNFAITNPQQEIKVAIIQNNNWKTTQYNETAQFIKNNQLVYSYLNKNNFRGGNEFRNFNNKRIRNTSMNVAKSEMKSIFHNYLFTDEPRRNTPYSYNPDVNGQYAIRTLDANNPDSEADYAMIHFTLKDYQHDNKDIYVVGQFNNYALNNKMSYLNDHYEATIKLKQGSYNYQYVSVEETDKGKIVDNSVIDGSFYNTGNEYTVLVYLRSNGGQYDQVIGIGRGHIQN